MVANGYAVNYSCIAHFCNLSESLDTACSAQIVYFKCEYLVTNDDATDPYSTRWITSNRGLRYKDCRYK